MPNFLFITLNDHVSWGGSEELWSKTALSFVNDYEVTVLKKQWPTEHDCIKQILASGGNVVYKPIKKPKHNGGLTNKVLTKLKTVTPTSKNDFESIKDITRYNLAIISVGNHVDSKIVSYTSYLKHHNVPYIIVVQLATSLKNLNDMDIKRLQTAYNDAIGIGCLSIENREVLKTQLGLTLKNVFKINNPFNYRQTYLKPKPNEVFQVACVAAYAMFHKGQDLLLKLLSQEKWQQRKICFNLYGSGINENHLKKLIDLYNIKHLVRLRGHVESKESIWSINQACIMPSRMEGQSLAMLEAMSFGRPIISTEVGAAPELIDDNVTGFLAKTFSVSFLDEALERAWLKRNEWIEMGKLSRSKLFEVIKEDPIVTFSNKIKEFL
ncbi:glycosyltransferase [Hyunsoonleella aestuarii]|uniref:Glycosyltransferase n=1 Tax=Hyunsoonleella aestuarii TaxID=912802 RepID=A0ABP8E6Z3_9FLAO|nr:glycosyltransferase [Hyunsoonleella aestuarii]